jgi:hypothetical protein
VAPKETESGFILCEKHKLNAKLHECISLLGFRLAGCLPTGWSPIIAMKKTVP